MFFVFLSKSSEINNGDDNNSDNDDSSSDNTDDNNSRTDSEVDQDINSIAEENDSDSKLSYYIITKYIFVTLLRYDFNIVNTINFNIDSSICL